MCGHFKLTTRLIATLAFLLLAERAMCDGSFSGWSIAVGWDQNTVNSEFNGTDALSGWMGDIILIPSVDFGGGPCVLVGLGIGGDGFCADLRVGFAKTKHSAEWNGLEFDVVRKRTRLFDFCMGSTTGFVNLYFTFNATIERIVVKDGSYHRSTVDDASYKGSSVGLGLGGRHFFSDRFSISTQVTLQYTTINSVQGVVDTEGVKIEESLNGPELELRSQIKYFFKLTKQ